MSLRRVATNGVTALAAALVTLLGFELGLRMYRRDVMTLASQRPASSNWVQSSRADYDRRLGWVPSPGAHGLNGVETVTEEGLRSNGQPQTPADTVTIVTVGDSFTFGDEVADPDTWPAQLSRELNGRVLNGGVFAYGVDQASMRGEILLWEHHPDWIVLAFIRDDLNRSQFSYYSAWKPYFILAEGELVLRNVPVPRKPAPEPPMAWLRSFLSRSFLASELASRYADDWWYYGTILREHADGVDVSMRLIERLDRLATEEGARLLAVALSTGGNIGTNEGMASIVAGIRAYGVEVLDLVPEIEQMLREGRPELLMPAGHYSPTLNHWVATRVADYIKESAPAGS